MAETKNLAAELRRLREAATPEKCFVYRSLKGPTVQVPSGWVFLASSHGTMEDCEFATFAFNNALPLAAELERLEKENAELRRLLAEAALWAAAYKFDPECGELLSQVDAAIGTKFIPRIPEADHEPR